LEALRKSTPPTRRLLGLAAKAEDLLASTASIEHNPTPPMLLRFLVFLALFGFVPATVAAAQQAVAANDLTVVFVGGYSANLATATSHFAALKTALTARSSNTTSSSTATRV
jgi:hypothetical protein